MNQDPVTAPEMFSETYSSVLVLLLGRHVVNGHVEDWEGWEGLACTRSQPGYQSKEQTLRLQHTHTQRHLCVGSGAITPLYLLHSK